MYHIVRVQVVKALCYIPQLWYSGSELDDHRNNLAHQVGPICHLVPSHIFSYATMFHPLANDLERRHLGGDSKQRHDVRMLHPLPHNQSSVGCLTAQWLQLQFPEKMASDQTLF